MSPHVIRRYGDPVLRTPAAPVTVFDAALRALVADLFAAVDARPGRAGLAAPQLGVAARVFVYRTTAGSGHVVNPRITAAAGTQSGDEACLSIPGLAFPTPRALSVTVRGADEHGEPLTVTGSGFLARVLQHETGHCDGVLYVDTLTGDTRRQALRAVRAAFRPVS
ncbi:peptide deformylase [Dactylosporangium sp. NPDC051541]|uniref:peptide deformylase n=1 Tax=Dactylosporangium sp. NPDC051541 TaxID=3363977 RepID=UPI00379B0C67